MRKEENIGEKEQEEKTENIEPNKFHYMLFQKGRRCGRTPSLGATCEVQPGGGTSFWVLN